MILSTMHQCKYIIPFAFPGKGGRKAGIPIPHQNNWFSTALGSLGELKKQTKEASLDKSTFAVEFGETHW